jgi:hypothetical protein
MKRRFIIFSLLLSLVIHLFFGCPSISGGSSGLKGWELNENNTGLAGAGITKETLPHYSGSAKPAAGTRIIEMRIETTLDLSAGNITLERCWIYPTSILRGNQIV